MNEYIQKIKNKQNLTTGEIEEVMRQIMSGEASAEAMAQFLLALREKGPSIDEITGAAKIMRKFVVGIKTKHTDVLDTCGTGGDKKNTFNISTITALVVAGAGAIVAKHGNRSVSSRCGSADLLESLGVNLTLDQNQLTQCLDEIGIAFLFAQKLHPAMKNVAPVRKQLGVETIFNILGPLTNPANATHQIIGVYKKEYVEPLCHVLKNLGLKKALVVHGHDGLDEITTTSRTSISEFNGSQVTSYEIDPEQFGIKRAVLDDLKAGEIETNVDIAKSLLDGEKGPKRDIVVLNAAFALYAALKVDDVAQGINEAQKSIDTGQAKRKLEQLKNFMNQ